MFADWLSDNFTVFNLIFHAVNLTFFILSLVFPANTISKL